MVLTNTHNLCFEQKYEKYQSFLSEIFQFLEVKFSIYLNRHVFVIFRCLGKAVLCDDSIPWVSSFIVISCLLSCTPKALSEKGSGLTDSFLLEWIPLQKEVKNIYGNRHRP